MAVWRVYESQRQPSLICGEPVFDFGTVKPEDNPVHEFTVSVSGRKPIMIKSVKPGCGSQIEVLDFSKEPIEPKQSGKIVLRLKTEYLVGKKENVVVLNSDDVIRPVFVLRLKADVQIPEDEKDTPTLAPVVKSKK
ncbi:hypothetical protein FACS189454_03780 [Planctomycetales bacterium]|nr:hypothetical protein FACS189454_03780 [Planctomycetales bacterium]